MTYSLITSHAGHTVGGGARGSGYEESVVARQFNDLLMKALTSVGQHVVDTTDNVGKSQSQNVANLVRNCNAYPKNGRLDISLHLNAGGGTGVEVLYYDQRELAANVSAVIAETCGFKNRGAKQRKDLAVLKGTNAPAILIELCFIDNASDMDIFMSNMQEVANAIVQAVTGNMITAPSSYLEVLKTGGFRNEEEVAKLIAYLLTKKLYSRMQTMDGDLSLETGGLSLYAKAEIEAFFKQNGWWYEIKQL
jgi:N-acetylmuramoyl-L-alanine amidase